MWAASWWLEGSTCDTCVVEVQEDVVLHDGCCVAQQALVVCYIQNNRKLSGVGARLAGCVMVAATHADNLEWPRRESSENYSRGTVVIGHVS